MDAFWTAVICTISVAALLVFLCLCCCFCFEGNEKNPRNESETGFQRVRQFEGPTQFNVESDYRPKPKTQISDKRVLTVEILEKVKVPDILREKHIAKPPVTLKIAKDLSKIRKQSCNKPGGIDTNTVFEDPKVLVMSKVLSHDWKKGQVIFVSEKKLKTFQCKKNQETGDWTPQEIEPRHALFAKDFHLLKEFLQYDEVNFICDVEE